ncbi:MAG: diguanylate cyclase [Parahaliea sp.]
MDYSAATAHQIANRLRELHHLNLRRHEDFKARCRDYLITGCRLLGMDTGVVSRVQGDTYEVLSVVSENLQHATGDIFLLEDTYCARVVDLASTVVIPVVGRDSLILEHPGYREGGLKTYAGAPVRVFDRIYGTLHFSGRQPRESGYSPSDTELIEIMAQALGRSLELEINEREHAAALARLHDNIELFESAFHFAAIGKALMSLEGQWLRVNQALVELMGYSTQELLQLDFQQMTHPDDLSRDLELLEEILSGKRNTYSMEKRYLHKDGHVVWGSLSVSLVRHASGPPRYLVAQIQDITTQKLAQQALESANFKLEQLARIDELTGVSNRRDFDTELVRELERYARHGRALSLLLLDVDRFKDYNDTFGHPTGDRALQSVAAAIRDSARQTDHVARYGGEEFAVILPETNAQSCFTVAERIRNTIANLGNLKRPITCSIGAHSLSSGGQDATATPECLLRCADEALYAAKQSGRNQTRLYDPECSRDFDPARQQWHTAKRLVVPQTHPG